MNFSESEKECLVKNIKLIFNYLKEKNVPNIRNDIYFIIIEIFNSEKLFFRVSSVDYVNSHALYYILENIDDFVTEHEKRIIKSPGFYNLLERYEEMYIILSNWNKFKNYCKHQVEEGKKISNKIKNFKL